MGCKDYDAMGQTKLLFEDTMREGFCDLKT